MGRILLSSDTESLMHPQLIGLDDVRIDAEEWLLPLASAPEVRKCVLAGSQIDEAWVVSSDEVPGINLAAALRADNATLPIYLVRFEPSGSDASRARQAGLTGMLSAAGFRERFYTAQKGSRRRDAIRKVAELEPLRVAGAEPLQAAEGKPHQASQAKLQEPGARPQQAPEAVSKASDARPQASGGKPAQAPDPTSPQAPGARLQQAPDLDPLRIVPSAPPKESPAFVLSVMSGSGGVGKSATVAVAAYLCAKRGFKTVVVDWDLQFGDMRYVMGDAASLGIDAALEDASRIAALAAEAADEAPALICAPKRLERSEELEGHLTEVLDAAAAAFEVVLVNTGSTWAEGHAQLLERSNCAVFLLDQRASSVRSCQHALDLCLRLGIATGSFAYALNRCERGALFTAVDIANVMHGAHIFELKDGGREVEELLGAGLAHDLASSKNAFCASVGAMLGEVLP